MSSGLLHVVAFKTKQRVDADKLARVRRRFQDLACAIDGVELISMGMNLSVSRFAEGWRFAAVLRLRDASMLPAYLANPAHQALSAETADGFYDDCVVLDLPIEPAIPTNQGDDR